MTAPTGISSWSAARCSGASEAGSPIHFELQPVEYGPERQAATAGQHLSADQKQVAAELLLSKRQRTNILGVLARDRGSLEKPDCQFAGRWTGDRRVSVEAIGETVKLQAVGGAAGAVCDERQGLAGKIGIVLAEQLDPVADRGNRTTHLVAQPSRQQFRHA